MITNKFSQELFDNFVLLDCRFMSVLYPENEEKTIQERYKLWSDDYNSLVDRLVKLNKEHPAIVNYHLAKRITDQGVILFMQNKEKECFSKLCEAGVVLYLAHAKLQNNKEAVHLLSDYAEYFGAKHITISDREKCYRQRLAEAKFSRAIALLHCDQKSAEYWEQAIDYLQQAVTSVAKQKFDMAKSYALAGCCSVCIHVFKNKLTPAFREELTAQIQPTLLELQEGELSQDFLRFYLVSLALAILKVSEVENRVVVNQQEVIADLEKAALCYRNSTDHLLGKLLLARAQTTCYYLSANRAKDKEIASYFSQAIDFTTVALEQLKLNKHLAQKRLESISELLSIRSLAAPELKKICSQFK